jgi:hypothetical protein
MQLVQEEVLSVLESPTSVKLRRGVPALAIASDLSVRDKLGHHAIEVVGLDAHCRGDLRNRDSRLAADQLERLIRTRVTAAASTRPTGPARSTTTSRCCGRRAAARPPRSPTTTSDKRRAGRLKLGYFLLELVQALVDVLHGSVDKIGQTHSPFG